MANLRDMRAKLQSLANLKATNLDHLNEIDELINDGYEYTWLCRPWSFAQKLTFMNMHPDIDYSMTAITANVIDFSRKVTFSGNIRSLTADVYEGQIFECQGREYKILKVTGFDSFQLAEPFRGTTAATDTTYKLKVKYYTLPEDLVQVGSISHRDAPIIGGRRQYLTAVLSRREEELQLAENRTASYADFYIHIPPANIPSGEKLKDLGSTIGLLGDLTVGAYYEFCWCFRKEMMYGPLSDSIIAQALKPEGGTQPNINLRTVTHDDVTIESPTYTDAVDKMPNVWEGMDKVLWTNVNFNHTTGKRLGLPKWVMVTRKALADSQYDHAPYILKDEESEWSINWSASVSPGNPKYIEIDGHHHRIRPYPRINSYDVKYAFGTGADAAVAPEQYFRQVELRYFYKPQNLAQITDAPEMPFELHDLVVYKALEDYYVKMGNLQLAQVYRSRFEADILAAEKKYIEHFDVDHQRAVQFSAGRGRFITPSTNIKRSTF
jgi:hypothetical protein